MDWEDCNSKGLASFDKDRYVSLKRIIKIKIKSADYLPDDLYYSKLTLLYDALRTVLELLAMKKKYKIYNHECYTAFLKQVMGLPEESDKLSGKRYLN